MPAVTTPKTRRMRIWHGKMRDSPAWSLPPMQQINKENTRTRVVRKFVHTFLVIDDATLVVRTLKIPVTRNRNDSPTIHPKHAPLFLVSFKVSLGSSLIILSHEKMDNQT